MEILQMGIIYGISFSAAGFLVGVTGAIIVYVGQPVIYSGFAFFPAWYFTFKAFKSHNIQLMHSKERALLIQIGTRMAKERLLSELQNETRANEIDPTRSPFIDEARKCLSYYLEL